MNVVQPYAKLVGPNLPTDPFTLDDGIRLLRRIEYFGRISHASEDAQTPDSWRRFIETVVLGHGDWSIVEHASVTVDMLVDRGITHEVVRHRLFSFTQASTRFINYAKKMPPSFILPPLDPAGVIPSYDSELVAHRKQIWQGVISNVEFAYKNLIDSGVAPQIARSVFPNALASRIAITGNLRNWRHMMLMRCTKETHPQFREVSIPLLAEFKAKIPILFDDLEPGMKQTDALKRMR